MLNVMFENSKGQKRIIGTVENEESAFKVINDFLPTTIISLIIKEFGRRAIRLLLLMWVAIQSSFTYRRFEK